MKPFHFTKSSSDGYADVLEKIEIMRSKLRWSDTFDGNDVKNLIAHCNGLRDEIMTLSRAQRIAQTDVNGNIGSDPKTKANSATQRRQSLIDRCFVFEGVFGESSALLDTVEIVEKAAKTPLPILIDGESGTGKELLAKIVHANSDRHDQPLISVNCGAIPENLLESELFGHRKGAFTGAVSDRMGKFESAHGGTIFLDEIGELPLHGQVKLLRALQSNEIQRVGSDKTTHVDIRVVAATNRDLLEMVGDNLFREDLFYRLSTIHVTLPPLRERKDEIALLIDFFADEAAESLNRRPLKFSPRLRKFLFDYNYPGNIRELRNIIFRLSCLAGDVADIDQLPQTVVPNNLVLMPHATPSPVNRSLSEIKKAASDAAEKQYLEEGLRSSGGKVAKFAQDSRMNRCYLQTLLKKHNIKSKEFKMAKSSKLA